MNGKRAKQTLRALGMLLSALSLQQLGLADDAKAVKYLITNDNVNPNTATFYEIGGTLTAPTLTLLVAVGTGGAGDISNTGASKTVNVANVGKEACAYISNVKSGNITGIVIRSQKYAGIFSASTKDTGLTGLVSNGTYLYAAYNSSKTIATFQMSAKCSLSFVGDVSAVGLANDPVSGMALHGSILVVTYGDGSIESFNASAGVPVSNDDKQYTSGYSEGYRLVGVDISKNGQYAVFGDHKNAPTAVEVSDISSGKLTPTVLYDSLGAGTGSANVLFSPSGNLLYITDTGSLQVTAARFSETSGKVSAGCVSTALKGHYVALPGGLALDSTSGTGGVVYVVEENATSDGGNNVGMLLVGSTGAECTLTEPTDSPVSDPNADVLWSIAVWPPRPF
jgi:hypothetical protein